MDTYDFLIHQPFLVETALLTHGLPSISSEEIGLTLPNLPFYAWVEEGEIVIGDLEVFLPFREREDHHHRINKDTLSLACEKKWSAPLTASGTMAVCENTKRPLAVSAGIAGIGNTPQKTIGADLFALDTLPVGLIASGFKDLMDLEETFKWLKDHRIKVVGHHDPFYEGFLFKESSIPLDGIYQEGTSLTGTLLLSPLSKKLSDRNILQKAFEEGKNAYEKGENFHPAVNGALDELTDGLSSRWQLDALKENIQWALEFK